MFTHWSHPADHHQSESGKSGCKRRKWRMSMIARSIRCGTTMTIRMTNIKQSFIVTNDTFTEAERSAANRGLLFPPPFGDQGLLICAIRCSCTSIQILVNKVGIRKASQRAPTWTPRVLRNKHALSFCTTMTSGKAISFRRVTNCLNSESAQLSQSVFIYYQIRKMVLCCPFQSIV